MASLQDGEDHSKRLKRRRRGIVPCKDEPPVAASEVESWLVPNIHAATGIAGPDHRTEEESPITAGIENPRLAVAHDAAFQKLEAFAFRPVTSSCSKVSNISSLEHASRPLDSGRSHVTSQIRNTEAKHTYMSVEEDEVKRVANSDTGRLIPGACEALLTIAHDLVAALEGLKFEPPVTCVYNPLVYAGDLHEQYIRKCGGRRVEVLLVGMNPGPFGMAQTGVPFGDSRMVQDFHGITGKVESPAHPHPKRPIYGLQCPRQEVSGQRLWGWARDRFGSASEFFKRFWVYNYCPLVFMEASGKNRTPDKLHPAERDNVKTPCNKALIKTISIVQPRLVVGVGKYAADRIRECGVTGVKIGDIIHPSPANPQANKDWAEKIEKQLQELGVVLER